MEKRFSLSVLLLALLFSNINAMDNDQSPNKKRGLEEYSGKEYSAPKRVRAMNVWSPGLEQARQEQARLNQINKKLAQECVKELKSEKGKQRQLETVKKLLRQATDFSIPLRNAIYAQNLALTHLILDHMKNNDLVFLPITEIMIRAEILNCIIRNDWPEVLQKILDLSRFKTEITYLIPPTTRETEFFNNLFTAPNYATPSPACMQIIKSTCNTTEYINKNQWNIQTPLHTIAEKFDNSHKLKVALKMGGNPSVKSTDGKTPLQSILPSQIRASHLPRDTSETMLQKITLLLNYGSNPNSRDNNGKTALHSLLTVPSCLKDNPIAQRSLRTIDSVNLDSYLHNKALIQERLKTLQLLVQHDADKNILDNHGNTPIKQALLSKDYGVLASEIFGYPLSVAQTKRAQELWNEISNMSKKIAPKIPQEIAREIYVKALENEGLISPAIFCQKLLQGDENAIEILQKRSNKLITTCEQLGELELANKWRTDLQLFLETYNTQKCPCKKMNPVLVNKNNNVYTIWFHFIYKTIGSAAQSINQLVDNCQCETAHKKRYEQQMQDELAQKMNELKIAMQ